MAFRSRSGSSSIMYIIAALIIIGLLFAVWYLNRKVGKAGSVTTVFTPAPPRIPNDSLSDDNGAVEMDDANYGPVMLTGHFPAGFVPGPTASPCIVARYLLDLPGMPSYLRAEQLPWTYEERLVLEAFEELCNDDRQIKTVRLQGGFGFFAYIIDKSSVPYDRYFVLYYIPKLGWQLGRCIPPSGITDPSPTESCLNFIGKVEELKVPSPPVITSVVPGPGGGLEDGEVTISFVATGDNTENITNFIVTANPFPGFTVNGPTSPIIMSGLDCDTLYNFRVTAENANGVGNPSRASNSIMPQCTVPALPPVVGTPVGNTSDGTSEGTSHGTSEEEPVYKLKA